VLGLGRLASGLSHHVRNALVAVKTFVDLAPDKLKAEGVTPQQSHSPAFWIDCQQKAASQVDKITVLLRELLAASGPGFKGFEDQVQLRATVESALIRHAQALESRKFQVENSVSELLPVMTADRFQIDRMLDLLLRDELASLPDGSRLRISATHRPASAGQPECVVLEVSDNGPGQPAEILKALFDPFVIRRDNPQEFGINLMAVYFIVHYHGGRIEASNGNPDGTVFRIILPVHCEVAALQSDDPQLLERARQNERQWEQLKAAE
jgi:signal transduction histidine kinase